MKGRYVDYQRYIGNYATLGMEDDAGCLCTGQPLIPEEHWGRVMGTASMQLEYFLSIYTVGVDDIDNEDDQALWGSPRENAICQMAEVLYEFECAGAASDIPASASIGSVSESYGRANSSIDYSNKALQKALYQAANRCLHFYRGVS